MAEVMESISELRTNLVTVQNTLNNPKEILPPEYIREIIHEYGEYHDQDIQMVLQELDKAVMGMAQAVEDEGSIDANKFQSMMSDLHHTIADLKGAPESIATRDYEIPSNKSESENDIL
jgi:hypothetical protein